MIIIINKNIKGDIMELSSCKKHCTYEVQDLPNLHLLKALGLREGINLKVQSKQPLGGPIVVMIGNRSIAIAKSLAKDIIVKGGS